MGRFIISIAAGFIILAIAATGLSVYKHQSGSRHRQELETLVDRYFKYYNHRDFEKIHGELGSRYFQEGTSYRRFARIMNDIYSGAGKYLSRENGRWREHKDRRRNYFIIVYAIKYRKKTTEGVFNFIMQDGEWKLLGLPPH